MASEGQVQVTLILLIVIAASVFILATNGSSEVSGDLTVLNQSLIDTTGSDLTVQSSLSNETNASDPSQDAPDALPDIDSTSGTTPTLVHSLENESENINANVTNETIAVTIDDARLNEALPTIDPAHILVNVSVAEENKTNASVEETVFDPVTFEHELDVNEAKLTKRTKDILGKANGEDEFRFIVRHKNDLNKDELRSFTNVNEFPCTKVVAFTAKTKELSYILSSADAMEIDQQTTILGENIPSGVERTGAPAAWNLTKGQGVRIAILDTGIAPHTDLLIAGGTSIVSDDFDDVNGHGTAVAGVLAATLTDEGIVGVAPVADVYAVKIMNGSSGSLSDAIAGVEWAIENNMSIVLMSFGTETYSQIFRDVLRDAYEDGTLFVAAAGNDGAYKILYPAAYDSVVAVGAVDKNGNRAAFSSYGFALALVAEGVDVNTTTLNDEYVLASGTSVAAPHVAGIAALLKAYNLSLTNKQLRAKLLNDAQDAGAPGKDDFYGFGIAVVNLTSANYMMPDGSYYYEIYNITDYGLLNETMTFWSNGTGSVDDVYFAEGYYLVRRLGSEETLMVSENGTMRLLVSLQFSDAWSADGSSTTDKKVWKDSYSMSVKTSTSSQDGECWDYGTIGNYNECYFVDTATYNACQSYCNSPTNCYIGSVGAYHQMFTGISRGQRQAWVVTLIQSGCGSASSGYDYYYSFDQKRVKCSSASYYYQGRYGPNAGDWASYSTTYSCGSTGHTCDAALENQTCDTQSCTPSSPCRVADGYACNITSDCLVNHYCVSGTCSATLPSCQLNGTINVIAQDYLGKAMTNLTVYFNGVANQTTFPVGSARINMTNTVCGAAQNITIKCSDNLTVCGTQTAAADFNGDTDSLTFDCTVCGSGAADLYVSQEDVVVDIGAKMVSVTVHSSSLSASFNVTVFRQDDSSFAMVENHTSGASISAGGTAVLQFSFSSLSDGDLLHIYLNTSSAEDKSNNYLFRSAFKGATVHLDVRSSLGAVDDVIEEYLGAYFDVVNSSINTPYTVQVGHPSYFRSFNIANDKLLINGRRSVHPYVGVVTRTKFSTGMCPRNMPVNISTYGNGIDGTIAAVKRLVNARSAFFSSADSCLSVTSYIDDYDTLGISVADLLHNPEHQPSYNQNTSAFASIVHDVLFDNNFELSILPVKTLNATSYNQSTILRVKHVNSDFSQNYRDVMGISATPVVLSRGIHSDLLTWDDFGKKLSSTGQDVWLIEMVGGPNTDEDCGTNCPNYTFSDLTNYYWPALIAGIEQYSGKNQIDYVGFSLGCSAALKSLGTRQSGVNNVGYYFDYNTGQYALADLSSNPVGTFVGVGCPGNFTTLPTVMAVFNYLQDEHNLTGQLRNEGQSHMTINNLKKQAAEHYSELIYVLPKTWLALAYIPIPGLKKMSVNIYDEFHTWMQDSSQPALGRNVTLNKFVILQGKTDGAMEESIFGANSDMIVPNEVGRQACLAVSSNDKVYGIFPGKLHFSLGAALPDDADFMRVVTKILLNEQIQNTSRFQFNTYCGEIS